MTFIKEHKQSVIIVGVCIILGILILIAIFGVMGSSSKRGEDGGRLANEEKVDEGYISEITNELLKSDIVKDMTYNKSIRILRFYIEIENGTKLEKAKELTNIITSKLSEKILTYYDIEVFLTTEDESNDYPVIGYLFKNSNIFSWSGEQTNEK